MLPGVDRPALAATIPTPHGPAVLLDVGASVECRPQHLLQFAVMGSVYARVGARHRAAARRAALDRRGGDERQRADARGASAAEGVAAVVSSATSRRATSTAASRRDRLRRLHRQRRAEDQRRAGRRSTLQRCGLHGGYCCRAAFAFAGSTTRSTAARRCSASTAWRSSAMAARAPRPCAMPWRWRIASPTDRFIQRVAARDRRRRGATTSDRVHLSRTGCAEGRHGPALADAYPICRADVRRSRRGARRAAQPHLSSTAPRSSSR